MIKINSNNIRKILKRGYCSYNFDIADIIIPFSQFIKSKNTQDKYSGNEDIPFNKKDLKFKKTSIDEFLC